jgi:hypothetical protein
MLRLHLTPAAVDQIVAHVSGRSPNDPLRFWVAAAAPGWSGPAVATFLAACVMGPRQDVAEAARLAQQGRYGRWNPL